MPVYHFHTRGLSIFRDMEGTDFANFPMAKAEAFKLAGQLMADDPADFDGDKGWVLALTNSAGLVLFMLQVQGAIAPMLRSLRTENNRVLPATHLKHQSWRPILATVFSMNEHAPRRIHLKLVSIIGDPTCQTHVSVRPSR